MLPEIIVNEFVNNRAEQLDADVTDEFIVPHFFERLTLHRDRMSVRVIGGRGCGKTIFLRYFSHRTQLSPKKASISVDTFNQGIGLYWRTDTGFCDLMKKEWLGDKEANSAFIHYIAVVVLEELACFVEALSDAPIVGGSIPLRDRPLPSSVDTLVNQHIGSYSELRAFARNKRFELSRWVQNQNSVQTPVFLRIEDILTELSDDLASSDPRLEKLFFRVFVDEFENLKSNQQRLICDLVKHPRLRYSFNLAMRRDSVEQFTTSGNEQVVEKHDIRTIDLEDLLGSHDEFSVLAAELLLMKLSKKNVDIQCVEFDVARLHDPGKLKERRNDAYIKAVTKCAGRILPGLKSAEIAQSVFQDLSLLRRWQDVVSKGLQKHSESNLNIEHFQIPEKAPASVVSAFLLNRDKPGPAAVLESLQTFNPKDRGINQFGDWVDNNLYGAIFYLYDGLPRRPNPLYAGFSRYCQMTAPNLRFFLEFCHTALRDFAFDGTAINSDHFVNVPHDVQSIAAKETSGVLLKDIPNLGLRGRALQTMIKRFGRLFQVAHRRASQSEPEINHFSIDASDKEQLNAETQSLLREAVIWSVLYEENDTKNKGDASVVQVDYIPNPIYSAHFGISFRKRRKLTLKASEINIIFSGSDENFESLIKLYLQKWNGIKLTNHSPKGLFE